MSFLSVNLCQLLFGDLISLHIHKWVSITSMRFLTHIEYTNNHNMFAPGDCCGDGHFHGRGPALWLDGGVQQASDPRLHPAGREAPELLHWDVLRPRHPELTLECKHNHRHTPVFTLMDTYTYTHTDWLSFSWRWWRWRNVKEKRFLFSIPMQLSSSCCFNSE